MSGIAVAVLGVGTALAQTPPAAPKVDPPAKDAHWFLDFSLPKRPPASANTTAKPPEAQRAKAYPATMEVSNDKGIRLIKTRYTDGVEETVYLFSGLRLVKRSGDEEIHVLDRLERSCLEYDAPPGTYPGLDWINQSNFRGEALVGDRQCYKFSRELPPLVSTTKKPNEDIRRSFQGLVTEAYVDKETLLPVAYRDGTTVISYRFTGVSSPITVPDEYRKAIRRQAGYRTE